MNKKTILCTRSFLSLLRNFECTNPIADHALSLAADVGHIENIFKATLRRRSYCVS
jgi:hypothetical protein